MMSRNRVLVAKLVAAGFVVAAAVAGGLLVGCDKKSSSTSTAAAPPPPPPPPPSRSGSKPSAPPRPAEDAARAKAPEDATGEVGSADGGETKAAKAEPVNVKDVLAGVKIDERVQFPQERSVGDASLVKSAAMLSSALAKGDSSAFGKLLTPEARGVLDQLVGSGQWEEATGRIEAVRVVKLSGNGEVQLALQEPGEAYVLAWKGSKKDGNWIFAADVASDDVRTRAAEFDGGVGVSAPSKPQAASEAKPKPKAEEKPAEEPETPQAEEPVDQPLPQEAPSKGRSPRQQAPKN